MTTKQVQTFDDYRSGKFSREEFLAMFSDEINNIEFVKQELIKAIESKDKEIIDRAVDLLWFHTNEEPFIDELHRLLIEPNHTKHQVIAHSLQCLGNPKSVPFIKKVLETNFDYLEYTYSDSGVIAKWFSWALYEIGTKEAIDLIEEYTYSKDEGNRNEMILRLKEVRTGTWLSLEAQEFLEFYKNVKEDEEKGKNNPFIHTHAFTKRVFERVSQLPPDEKLDFLNEVIVDSKGNIIISLQEDES